MSALPAVREVSPSIDAISRPARTFTGDFYFTHRHEDRIWLAIGDVAGKGLPAAIVMAMIQEELEHRITSCAATECDPSRTMWRLDEFLRPLIPRNRFATAVIGHLSDDGELTIVNAGHCPPLIVRRDGRVEAIGSTGPLLGILEGAAWHSTTLQLDEGDALVLYSDGVIEAEAWDGEELGVHGLKEILARRPDEIAEAVFDAIDVRNDDLTLVVVRR